MTTTWLECSACNEMFEVSNAVADAMHQWREESGDPYLCVDCATEIAWGDAIIVLDTVGGNSDSRYLKKMDRRGVP